MACPFRSHVLLPLTLAALLFAAPGGFPQSTATDWYQKGMSSAALDDKIEAFEKATQLDPNFVEAYFYLGLAYKAKQMYPEAQVAFNKAYFTNPYALNNEIKMRILFELGNVHTILGNPEQARDAYKGARDLSGNNRALQGRISLELGRIYIQQELYRQAIAELRQGKELWPQNAREFDKLITQAGKLKSALEIYQRGVEFLEDGQYARAAQTLTQVNEIQPNFKDTAEKLRIANSRLDASRSRQRTRLDGLYAQAAEQANRGNVAEAIRLFEQILAQDAGFRDVRQRVNQLKNAGAQTPVARKPVDRLNGDYQRGRRALQRGEWQQAVQYLSRVAEQNANYKQVGQLLAQARRELERETEQVTTAERLYQQGKARVAERRWKQAFNAFKDLEKLSPGYKDVAAQLNLIKVQLRRQTARLDSLYRVGVSAMNQKQWARAVLAFENIKLQDPGFRDTNDKLVMARLNLQKSGESANATTPVWLWVLSTVSAFLLPVAAVLIFSPTTRARLYLLQGNYDKATEIYERVLEKRPEKVKLYPILANIYLLEDRRDARAIKVFETILKLNIFTPKRVEINSIVANYYLNEGRTDGNAIAIMERELSNKIKKLESGTA